MNRALVIGVGGFLGSNVYCRLVREGWSVSGLTRDRHATDLQRRLGALAYEGRLVEGDARDVDLIDHEVRGVDAVYMFAGHSGAARSLLQPVDDLEANLTAQLIPLQVLARQHSTARVIFPGSRLQYAPASELPVTEDYPQEPVSPYGLHKMVADGYHRIYNRVHSVASVRLRISIPYGPGQERDDRSFGIVGNFFATAARGQQITLYGGGRQLRDFVFIDDVMDMVMIATTHPDAPGRAFNVGGGRGYTLREMAEAIVTVAGRGHITDGPWPDDYASVETGDYVADISRAKADLGWHPQTDMATGVDLTWERSKAFWNR
jgi:UDP-glucose 4-epimerase